ncbi:WD40 repeat domain-containing protein, partial [bacterium]|nr:WD40 repeat domain-containing protein [bacterium]
GNRIAFTTDGMTLISFSTLTNSVYFWDMTNLSVPPLMINAPAEDEQHLSFSLNGNLAVSPNGDFIATSNEDNATLLWNLENLSLPLELPRMGLPTFSTDGLTLATQEGNTIFLWNPYDLDQDPEILLGHESTVTGLAFSPDGLFLASSASLDECNIRLWELRNPYSSHSVLEGYTDGLNEVIFSPDGNTVAGACPDTVQVWNLVSLESPPVLLLSEVSGSGSGCAMAYSPDRETFATTGANDVILLWNLDDLSSPIDTLEGFEFVFDIAFHPDGSLLAAGGWDASVRLWNMNSLDDLPALFEKQNIAPNISVAFSPDGKTLAAASIHSLCLWNVADPSISKEILPGYDYKGEFVSLESASFIAFSPDGKTLASTNGYDGRVLLWDIDDLSATPNVLLGRDARSNQTNARNISIRLDGRLLAVRNGSISASIWRLDELNTLPIVLEGGVEDISFSPDSKTVATVSDSSGDVSLWIVDFDRLFEISCQVVGRNFTQIEWDTYFPGEDYRITCPQWPSLAEER